MNRTFDRADVGLIGLAVMGQNLVSNMADHGFRVAVYNRTTSVATDFAQRAPADHDIVATASLSEFVEALERPRRVVLLVKAGAPVDAVLEQLLELLDAGDIIVDGGNSLYTDTERRLAHCADHGVHFVGSGVSGGEEGARTGPSIMPGGDAAAWPHLRDLLQKISAKAGPGNDEPCCEWLGSGGAGHFVKMIHNGIEYGDMQVLAEAYALMTAQGRSAAQIGQVFKTWNAGPMRSFLVEISAQICAELDPDADVDRPLVEQVLDAAGQKGTGKWTVVAAMDVGQPMTLVAEAVCARMVSSLLDVRRHAASVMPGPDERDDARLLLRTLDPADLAAAAYGAKLVSYAQGFMVLAAASDEHAWSLDLAAIARLWRGGCIIRAAFLDDIVAAYRTAPDLANLLFDPFFTDAMNQAQGGLRRTVVAAAAAGVAVPAYSSALSFFDGLRTARGPANLIQAQRDFFGAHTFERVDRPRGEWFHHDWADTGGVATSGSYSA